MKDKVCKCCLRRVDGIVDKFIDGFCEECFEEEQYEFSPFLRGHYPGHWPNGLVGVQQKIYLDNCRKSK